MAYSAGKTGAEGSSKRNFNPADKQGVVSSADRLKALEGQQYIVVDSPAPLVQRVTLNRPEKRNALRSELQTQLFEALRIADQDPSIAVTIIRGAGKSFCSGYDLGADPSVPSPFFEAAGDGQFQRSVVKSWFEMWDLRKPVIAQVHGHCLAGGSELASACDLIYVADNAKIGYPPVRSMGLPDTQIFPWVCGMRTSMELMLTGDSMSGTEAVATRWANRCFPAQELDARVLAIAQRVAQIPVDLLQYNKRSVHRAMEVMGMRTALRYGTDLQALSFHAPSSVEFMQRFEKRGEDYEKGTVSQAWKDRDGKFGDSQAPRPSKHDPKPKCRL
jgi:enoyl-CoA hydratase